MKTGKTAKQVKPKKKVIKKKKNTSRENSKAGQNKIFEEQSIKDKNNTNTFANIKNRVSVKISVYKTYSLRSNLYGRTTEMLMYSFQKRLMRFWCWDPPF